MSKHMGPSGLKSVFEVDNTHKRFKGTGFDEKEFWLKININDWVVKAVVRADLRATKEVGFPPPLKDGEVDDVTTPDGIQRRVHSKMSNYYGTWTYKFTSVIEDWMGFVDENGEEIECTEENIIEKLQDPGYAKFFEILYVIINEAGEKTPEEKVVEMGLDSSSDGSNGITDQVTAELD